MAIPGQANINIGAENQQANSDNLYDAFHKVQNNFTSLFTYASPYNIFSGDVGISVSQNSVTSTVTILNTGVTNLGAGTGITLSAANGNVIISASGNGTVGVTNVGISSTTLTVTNTPIVSSGVINIELPLIPTGPGFAAGQYTAPTLTVDNYGRITNIANTAAIGTVTSVAIQANGNGLSVTNSPITSSGIIYLENTGVTKLRAGSGIILSGETGEISISSQNDNQGSVTRIDFYSDTLSITGSPVTSAGNVAIEIPNNVTVSGNIRANTLTANSLFSSYGNMFSYGNAFFNNVTANLYAGNFQGEFNGLIGANGANYGFFTDVISNNITGNSISVMYDDNALTFENTSGNTIRFLTPNTITDSSYYLPNVPGSQYSVLGVIDENIPQTLGWKTLTYQTITVVPLVGDPFQVSTQPILRAYPIKLNGGGYLNINIS